MTLSWPSKVGQVRISQALPGRSQSRMDGLDPPGQTQCLDGILEEAGMGVNGEAKGNYSGHTTCMFISRIRVLAVGEGLKKEAGKCTKHE